MAKDGRLFQGTKEKASHSEYRGHPAPEALSSGHESSTSVERVSDRPQGGSLQVVTERIIDSRMVSWAATETASLSSGSSSFFRLQADEQLASSKREVWTVSRILSKAVPKKDEDREI